MSEQSDSEKRKAAGIRIATDLLREITDMRVCHRMQDAPAGVAVSMSTFHYNLLYHTEGGFLHGTPFDQKIWGLPVVIDDLAVYPHLDLSSLVSEASSV